MQRAMRAPGHPQSCFLTDCPLDDLAAKLGMDPLQVRLKNLPPERRRRRQDRTAVVQRAAQHASTPRRSRSPRELSDWEQALASAGQGPGNGPIKHGIGMALHTWGGAGQPHPTTSTSPSAATARVLVESSTQDLGTGERTVLAIVVGRGPRPGAEGHHDPHRREPVRPVQRLRRQHDLPRHGPGGLRRGHGGPRRALRQDRRHASRPRRTTWPSSRATSSTRAANKKYAWKEACAKLGMETGRGQRPTSSDRRRRSRRCPTSASAACRSPRSGGHRDRRGPLHARSSPCRTAA